MGRRAYDGKAWRFSVGMHVTAVTIFVAAMWLLWDTTSCTGCSSGFLVFGAIAILAVVLWPVYLFAAYTMRRSYERPRSAA
jgi:uncharacterized membrane protein